MPIQLVPGAVSVLRNYNAANKIPTLNGISKVNNNLIGKPSIGKPSTPTFGQKLGEAANILKDKVGSLVNNIGEALGPMGIVQVLEDTIKSGQSQFDTQGFNDSLADANKDFLNAAGSASNTSDLLGLSDMRNDIFGNLNETINSQDYKWDGSLLGLLGVPFGAAATERDKQSARNALTSATDAYSRGLNNAVNRVGNISYRNNMLNYFNNAAFGGPLHTHWADFSDDIIRVDTGGSHESNPIGGVPAGVDPMGIPNLVEEGERIWDDYVFSDRLKMPKSLVNKYKLGGRKNKSMTFAEGVDKISEKLGTELRPNDPITKRTKNAILSEFEDVQEEKRIAQEKRDMIKAMSEMSPEEFESLFMQNPIPTVPQQETTPDVSNIPPQGMSEEEEPLMQEPVGFEPQGLQGFALGGNLFVNGGKERFEAAIRNGSLRWDSKINKWVGSTGVVGEGVKQYSNDYLRSVLGYNPRIDSSERNNVGPTRVLDGRVNYGDNIYVAPEMDSSFFSGINGGGFIPGPTRGVQLPETLKKIVSTDQHGPFLPEQRTSQRSSGPSRSSRRASTAPTSILSAINTDIAADTDALANAILSSTPTVENTPINLGRDNLVVSKMAVPSTNDTNFKTLPTWMRYAPVVGGGLAVLSDIFGNPDYSGAESLLSASRRLSNSVNIPVTTIGNRIRRNPYDERLMVNRANQNLLAGMRSTIDNAGGNRAYRQFANNLMAYNNQAQLSDIDRNAYLANRQDALQTADFNRATDLYNMNAINQRNLTQAQLNSNRQMQGFNSRLSAQHYLDSLRRQDDQLASADFTGLMQSLGNIGNENEQRNWLTGLAKQGVLNFMLGNSGDIDFVPSRAKNGGKIKAKKRRF